MAPSRTKSSLSPSSRSELPNSSRRSAMPIAISINPVIDAKITAGPHPLWITLGQGFAQSTPRAGDYYLQQNSSMKLPAGTRVVIQAWDSTASPLNGESFDVVYPVKLQQKLTMANWQKAMTGAALTILLQPLVQAVHQLLSFSMARQNESCKIKLNITDYD